MKKLHYIISTTALLFVLVSCQDKKKPNYQYFPNMQESVGYEAYSKADAFPNEMEAQLPAEGSIARGWQPFDYAPTEEGYLKAKEELKSPLEASAKNDAKGKELYGIYCAVCHGKKGDGQGPLVKKEKFLGVPSYETRDLTEGNIYYVIMYGRNSMGSHAAQINEKERWQVTQYVMKLRSNL